MEKKSFAKPLWLTQGCPDPKEYLHFISQWSWDGLDSSETPSLLPGGAAEPPLALSFPHREQSGDSSGLVPASFIEERNLFFARGVSSSVPWAPLLRPTL